MKLYKSPTKGEMIFYSFFLIILVGIGVSLLFPQYVWIKQLSGSVVDAVHDIVSEKDPGRVLVLCLLFIIIQTFLWLITLVIGFCTLLGIVVTLFTPYDDTTGYSPDELIVYDKKPKYRDALNCLYICGKCIVAFFIIQYRPLQYMTANIWQYVVFGLIILFFLSYITQKVKSV